MKPLFFGGFEGNWANTTHAILSSGNENFTVVPTAGYASSSALRANYSKGSYASHSSPAGTSATIFRIPFSKKGIGIGPKNDLYFAFLVKFEPGFEFGKSGKLPGLAGGADNAGGNPPNGYDGWSGRLDWVSNGGLISYMYVPGIKKYGLELPWKINNRTNLIRPGKWECLEMHYRMNTPGKNNGIAEGWLNNNLALRKKDMYFRSTDKLSIDNILFSTFFGGATPDYASPKTQYADFDNLILSKQFIDCPSTATYH